MEKFLEQMARVMHRWPDHAQWSVSQLVDYTHFPADDVVAWMSFGVQRQLATDSRLNYSEAVDAMEALTAAQLAGTHVKYTPSGPVATNVRTIYEQILAKNRTHMLNKDWRRAYLNLVNFLNQHKAALPIEVFAEALSECLRLAPKANANPQEIYGWLDAGIKIFLEDATKAGVIEALDFIEAYSEPLRLQNAVLIEKLFESVRPLAHNFGLTDELGKIHAAVLTKPE